MGFAGGIGTTSIPTWTTELFRADCYSQPGNWQSISSRLRAGPCKRGHARYQNLESEMREKSLTACMASG